MEPVPEASPPTAAQPAFSGHSAYAPAVRTLLAERDPRFADVDLTVHPDDDMFKFSVNACGQTELGVMAYFRAGLSIHDTSLQLARWWWGDLDRPESWLDFAAGYGRSTRFLTRELGPDRVWVGEIQPDAVDFQVNEFGVHGLVSTVDPDEFRCDRRFDVIFVASLFSHLPETTFGKWLGRLFQLLTDAGVLIFSLHDASLADDGVVIPDRGLLFVPQTEVDSLDTSDYGATLVTETFVREQVARFTGAGYVERLPRALCFTQDVYVVGRDPSSRGRPVLVSEPAGALDVVDIAATELTLQGWAVDFGASTCRVVAVLGDKVVGEAETGGRRVDVAAHYHRQGDTSFEHSGWACVVPIPDRLDRGTQQLLVKAVSTGGKEFVLDCAPLAMVADRTHPGAGGSGATVMPSAPDGRTGVRRRVETARNLYREDGWTGVGRYLVGKVRR
jgi:SAM-dependent methyltransferase